jgi:hypothetical protein
MWSLLGSLADVGKSVDVSLLLSIGSSLLTGYFWLVKMNQERAGLRLYRLTEFRPDRLQCSDVPGTERATWYGDVVLANPSTLPSVVVQCQVQLLWQGVWLDGTRVLDKKEDVPWTIEPLRVLSRKFGCSFLVAAETPRERLQSMQRLRFILTTVDGRRQVAEMQTRDPDSTLAQPLERKASERHVA